MSWLRETKMIPFQIATTPIGTGGFRTAYRATSTHPQYSETTWVIKKYLEQAKQDILELHPTIEAHTKRAVQMHLVAKCLTEKFNEAVKSQNLVDFGKSFKYLDVFCGQLEDFVTIEPFVEGSFTKYVNNSGHLIEDNEPTLQAMAECLAHFSHNITNGKLMITDIQGSDSILYDPEIASKDIKADDTSRSSQYLFCAGNLSVTAMETFFIMHKCSQYCASLDLKTD